MAYNKISCPLSTTIKNALNASLKLTMVAKIRPTWTTGEAWVFGAYNSNQSVSPASTPGFFLDLQASRAVDGTVNNSFGSSCNTNVTYEGATFAGLTPTSAWIWVAVTMELNTNPMRRRLYYRYSEDVAWTVHATTAFAVAGPAASITYNTSDVIQAGNHTTTSWLGGVAYLSVRSGMSGTGTSAMPGDHTAATPTATELAEWHPTPPDTTYTDAYNNTWTIAGSDWLFGTT